PVFLESSQVEEVLTDSGIEEEKAKEISKKYEEFFNADVPDAEELIDEKALRESQIRSERKKLMNEISELSSQNERLMESTDPVAYGDSTNPKVILRVSEEKAEEIRTKDFDGTKCLVIPLSEMEETIINGKSVKFS
ncbi:MAG: DUF4317 domain-containing protein, partial [Lachnospiraceae bacterium]|nr:DUF4317 domain-containing protein [Lachnospiraceae bacterium]